MLNLKPIYILHAHTLSLSDTLFFPHHLLDYYCLCILFWFNLFIYKCTKWF